jgi:hypothetical protein
MLPDYPRLKKKLNDKMAGMVRDDMDKDPFLSAFPKHEAHEGNSMTTNSIEGFSSTTDYPETASHFELTFKETIELGPEAIFAQRLKLSKEMIEKLTKLIIERLEEVPHTTGTVVDARKVDPSSNPLLDMLEKIEIDFDKNGNPKMPTIMLPPETLALLKEKSKAWANNPDMKKREKELIERKREQWLDRENSRKLVD